MMRFRVGLGIAVLCCFLSSCGFLFVPFVQHIGRVYPPVAMIDVVYAERDIRSPRYEFMGEVFVIVNNAFILPEIEQMLIEAGKSRGAHSILISYNRTSSHDGENFVQTPILRGRLIRYIP